MPEHYSQIDEDPSAGIDPADMTYVRPIPNGAPVFTGTPEWRIVARGTPDTVVRRSRTGRSTYEVTAGHVRRMVGPDPVTGDLVSFDHATLVDMADAWVRQNDTTPHVCTCDDLTVPFLVLDRKTRRPIWRSATADTAGHYLTAERSVRRCHCRPFPALMGLDGGRRNAWHERTPAQDSGGMSTARVRRRTALRMHFRSTDGGDVRTDALGRTYRSVTGADGIERIFAPWADGTAVWVGHELKTRNGPRTNGNPARAKRRAEVRASAPWADERAVIDEALNATIDPTVSIEFPGVVVTVRRDTGIRWKVTIVRQGATTSSTTLRCRTSEPIARAVIA